VRIDNSIAFPRHADPCSVFYEFFISYLIAPGTFSTAHVVEVVSSLPDSVKYAGKAILAAPFAFHSFNGIRHLNWDLLKGTSSFVESRFY
jgi:succinate dehydrogenase (ubiquinone) cytochrome b560 subunit